MSVTAGTCPRADGTHATDKAAHKCESDVGNTYSLECGEGVDKTLAKHAAKSAAKENVRTLLARFIAACIVSDARDGKKPRKG